VNFIAVRRKYEQLIYIYISTIFNHKDHIYNDTL